ncbi:MAG: DUF4248 domain-containing protein [Bacteroidales bacterium]|nr:DUF4248 domain-containing protein [Bacteroidales bacterium]
MTKPTYKAMNTKELAALYNVHPRTLNRWLKNYRDEIGERHRVLWTPKQVRTIRELIG